MQLGLDGCVTTANSHKEDIISCTNFPSRDGHSHAAGMNRCFYIRHFGHCDDCAVCSQKPCPHGMYRLIGTQSFCWCAGHSSTVTLTGRVEPPRSTGQYSVWQGGRKNLQFPQITWTQVRIDSNRGFHAYPHVHNPDNTIVHSNGHYCVLQQVTLGPSSNTPHICSVAYSAHCVYSAPYVM